MDLQIPRTNRSQRDNTTKVTTPPVTIQAKANSDIPATLQDAASTAALQRLAEFGHDLNDIPVHEPGGQKALASPPPLPPPPITPFRGPVAPQVASSPPLQSPLAGSLQQAFQRANPATAPIQAKMVPGLSLSAGPSRPIQRLWNKEKFRSVTKEGMFDRRGDTIKSIEKLIDEYGRLNPYRVQDLKTAQDLVKAIREHVNNWMSDHTGDSSRADRMEGMKAFLKHIVDEEMPHLDKIEQDISNTTNTTAGTLKIEPSRRENEVKTIKEKYEGSASSALEKVGFLLDASVPNPGDKSKLEVELKVPCDPSGVGFVGLHLLCQSERKKLAQLNARCELTVTGGAKFGGLAELKAELGGYFESEGKDAATVMKMISYVLYRRFVESKALPAEMSNFMWGGTTSGVGYKRAEKWAANVEKEVFAAKDSKNYVESGALASGTAQGGIKNVGGVGLSGKVGAKASYGTRYDHKALAQGRGGAANVGKTTHDYEGRGDAQKSLGRTVIQIEVPIEGQVAMFKVTGKVKFVAMENPAKSKDNLEWYQTNIEFDEASAEASAQFLLPIHKDILGGLPEILGQFVNTVAQNMISASRNDAKQNPRILGSLVAFSEDAAISAVGISNISGQQFAAFTPGKSLNDISGFGGSKGEIGLRLGYKLKYKPGDIPADKKDEKGSWLKGISQEIQIDYVKSGTMLFVDKILEAQENAVDMLSIKQETLSRLFTLKYEKGGDWTINPETKLELNIEKAWRDRKPKDQDSGAQPSSQGPSRPTTPTPQTASQRPPRPTTNPMLSSQRGARPNPEQGNTNNQI